MFYSTPGRPNLIIPHPYIHIDMDMGPTALFNSLTGFWKLDESSGNRADSIGSNTLTDNNTVTSATGNVYGTAASFASASSEYLSKSSPSGLDTDDNSFWVCAWVYLATKVSFDFVNKTVSGGGGDEFGLDYNSGTDRFRFYIRSSGGTYSLQAANTLGSPSTSTWYMLLGYHDVTNDQVAISVNNGGFDTLATGGNHPTSGAPFYLGTYRETTNYFNGRMGPVMFGRLYVPTAADRTFLYNSGAGLTLDAMKAY